VYPSIVTGAHRADVTRTFGREEHHQNEGLLIVEKAKTTHSTWMVSLVRPQEGHRCHNVAFTKNEQLIVTIIFRSFRTPRKKLHRRRFSDPPDHHRSTFKCWTRVFGFRTGPFHCTAYQCGYHQDQTAPQVLLSFLFLFEEAQVKKSPEHGDRDPIL
jgi:hypothetical protein